VDKGFGKDFSELYQWFVVVEQGEGPTPEVGGEVVNSPTAACISSKNGTVILGVL
jgi:hypothetical protein